jgi:hypothetical protein
MGTMARRRQASSWQMPRTRFGGCTIHSFTLARSTAALRSRSSSPLFSPVVSDYTPRNSIVGLFKVHPWCMRFTVLWLRSGDGYHWVNLIMHWMAGCDRDSIVQRDCCQDYFALVFAYLVRFLAVGYRAVESSLNNGKPNLVCGSKSEV